MTVLSRSARAAPAGSRVVEPAEPGQTATRPSLSLPEVVVGATTVALAVVAWVSLLLANFHAHSLPAVIVGSVLLLGLLGAVALRLGGRPRVHADRPTSVVLAVLALGAALLYFPGFHYGVTDKDPGGYVAHGVAIAHTGSYSFHDDVLERVPAMVKAAPKAHWPAIWISDERSATIVPQFYHLWPALFATAYDVGSLGPLSSGLGALSSMAALVALLAVLVLTVTLRRAFNLPTAAVGGLLLATNMLEVWQARYPTTEAMAQLLFLAGLFGVVLALRTGWRPAAGLAGLLLGVSWLNRADALLLVLVAVGVAAVLIVLRRFDARCWWFAGGLGLVLPHALWQAYASARAYTLANKVPGLPKVAVVVGGVLGLAVVLRLVAAPLARRLDGLLAVRRTQLVLGAAICAVAFVLLVVGFLRPKLFGPAYFIYNGVRLRSYDEQALRRLSWFVTLPGFALMGLGVAVVALRRWSAAAWAVVLPSMLIFPVYAYRAFNSTRLMWWTRRFTPVVLPGIVILAAVAIGFGLVWAHRRRPLLRLPAALAAGFLLVVYLHQSLPLRAHSEFGGSFGVSARIAALSGSGEARGVYLFQAPTYCCFHPTSLFGAAVWLERDRYSALLPRDPAAVPAYVDKFRRAFPRSPVFLVWAGDQRPPVPGLGLSERLTIRQPMSYWEESDTHRPARPRTFLLRLSVWQVAGPM